MTIELQAQNRDILPSDYVTSEVIRELGDRSIQQVLEKIPGDPALSAHYPLTMFPGSPRGISLIK